MRGFSLFELTLVVLIVGIIGAIVIPTVGNGSASSRLSAAANVLASDIEFCASECITHPSDTRAIAFDLANNKYTVENFGTGATIAHPADTFPFVNDFSTGRNSQFQGVTLSRIVVGSGTMTTLTFDAYGRPVITADMAITLAYHWATMTVTVQKGTGEVTITAP